MLDHVNFDHQFHSAFTAPESAYHASPITPECSSAVSSKYMIPMEILAAIRLAEGGRPGQIVHNKNGTVDAGPMQINSSNWKKINKKLGISPIEIRYNGCKNFEAGAYLVREHLDENQSKITGWPTLIEVVANYHSKTPKHNQRYQTIIRNKLTGIVGLLRSDITHKSGSSI